jgi:hypothetical protein
MDASKPISMGVESVALALIFAPEPFSTFVGIGLLAASRASKIKRVSQETMTRPANRFEDYYRYNIGMVHRGNLAYRVTPIRDGQLPGTFPQTVKLYDTQAWGHYRKSAYNYLNVKKPPQFSGLQKGLLHDTKRGINRKQY